MLGSLQFHQLKCTCGHSACLSVHGYYHRTVRTSKGSFRLRICRVICSECGRTHAILPESIVPYDQISLEDQRVIVIAYENGTDRNPAAWAVLSMASLAALAAWIVLAKKKGLKSEN